MTNREVSISEMKIGSEGCEVFAHDVTLARGVYPNLSEYDLSVKRFSCLRRYDATCALNGLSGVALKCFLQRESSREQPTMQALVKDAATTIQAELGCTHPETK